MDTWNIDAAKKWLYNCGMEHIQEGEFLLEGAELVNEAEVGSSYTTMKGFKTFIREILWWSMDEINDAVGEIMSEQEKQVATLTVKDIVSKLIEPHGCSWAALPTNVRDMMLSYPEKFEFRFNKDNSIPMIVHNGVILRCCWRMNSLSSGDYYWVLEAIEPQEK